MKIPYEGIFVGLMVFGIALVILQSLLTKIFKGRIKLLYPEKWNYIKNDHGTFVFMPVSGWYKFTILKGGHKNLDDKKVRILGAAIRILYIVFIALFVAYGSLLFLARNLMK